MAKFTAPDEDRIARDLAQCSSSRDRSRAVSRYASLFSCSAQAVYQAAARGGYSSRRARRTDAGSHRKPVPESAIAAVATLIHETHTEKNRIPLSAESAIFIAETRGIIPPGSVSPEYLNRWMRTHAVSKTDALRPAPHINLRSLHPNHLHTFDTSNCAQWYLADDGRVQLQARDFEVYKNKPGAASRPKLIRYLLVDHCTGAFFAWYAHTEQAVDLLDFLYLAWAPKSHIAQRYPNIAQRLALAPDALASAYPFRGVPLILYSDRGAALEADVTARLLDSLGVRHISHQPGNPRAKGSVEGMMYKFEAWFEARTKLEGATSLDQLNAWALDACIHHQVSKRHTRHGLPRFDAWNAWITPETLREIPPYEDFRALASTAPVTRRVRGDLTISYKPEFRTAAHATAAPHTYRIPDPNLLGAEVTVRTNYYEYPAIRVTFGPPSAVHAPDANELLLHPIPKDEAGFNLDRYAAVVGENFVHHPHTDTQRNLAALGATAPTPADRARITAAREPLAPSSEPPPPAAAEIPPSSIHGRFVEAGAAPTYLPREGHHILQDRGAASTSIPRFEARLRILDALQRDFADLLPHQQAALDAIPDTVALNELHRLADQVRQGIAPAAVVPIHAQEPLQ